MQTLPDAYIQRLAESCVDDMGDVFWDHDEIRDEIGEYTKPRQVATESVASALRTLAASMESNLTYTTSLRLEYREIVARTGKSATDADIVLSLVAQSAWTEEGARAVLMLAKRYGTSILQNALALAEALGIEDGEAGL